MKALNLLPFNAQKKLWYKIPKLSKKLYWVILKC